MERRKFLIGLGSVAAGSATLVGSGAFTTVEADRAASVETTDDSDAYLRLEPADGPNGTYAQKDTQGRLRININGNQDVDGHGVNPKAETTMDDVFVVENQGTQPVDFWLKGQSTYHKEVDFTVDGHGSVVPEIGGEPIEIAVGEEIAIDIEIDTDQEKSVSLMNGLSVHAEAEP